MTAEIKTDIQYLLQHKHTAQLEWIEAAPGLYRNAGGALDTIVIPTAIYNYTTVQACIAMRRQGCPEYANKVFKEKGIDEEERILLQDFIVVNWATLKK